ncbi:MAG: efflux RND transporter periplasmic adaptor subunit [Nodosilinea sp.]
MAFPFSGQQRSLPLWLGALLAGTVVLTVGIGVLIWRSRSTPYDINSFTTVASLQPLTVRVSASGRVKPGQTVNLSPANAGIVEHLYVEQGDRVNQGQLIARMDSRDIKAQINQYQAAVAEAKAALADLSRGSRPAVLAQARAGVATAQTQVVDSQARLDLARAELDRNQALFDRGAISRATLDNALREQRSAQAGLAQARSRVAEAQQRLQDLENQPTPEALTQAQARLTQVQAQLQGSQVRLAEREIRAPFAGVITQKFATAGAFVTPTTSASEASSATSTAIVALAQDLEVLAEVPEANISLIQLGQRVEVEADGLARQTFSGRVKRIAPEAIERQNVTLFQVRIQLDSGKDQLRSNMTVNVAFIANQVADALVVPTVAVVTQRGQTGLLVPGKGQDIVFQPVTLGPQAGDKIQILNGLQAGDRVFVNLPPGKSLESLTLRQDR